MSDISSQIRTLSLHSPIFPRPSLTIIIAYSFHCLIVSSNNHGVLRRIFISLFTKQSCPYHPAYCLSAFHRPSYLSQHSLQILENHRDTPMGWIRLRHRLHHARSVSLPTQPPADLYCQHLSPPTGSSSVRSDELHCARPHPLLRSVPERDPSWPCHLHLPGAGCCHWGYHRERRC